MKTIRKLAIVDDDSIFVFLTKKNIALTHLVEQMQVFENGFEILEFLKNNLDNPEQLPEIILLDLSMPIMDGWQFLEQMETIKNNLPCKISMYIVSSSISPDDIKRAQQISLVTDYILKPISKEKFIDLVEKL